MPALAILIIVCVLTYTFEIVFGLAGTILMVPLLSVLYNIKTLVVYSVLPQILVAVIGLVRSPEEVNARFMTGMLFFAGFGAIVGFALFYYFTANAFQILLASAISATGLFLVIAQHKVRFGPKGLRALDVFGGLSQALFGMSGPIAMMRLLATFKEKATVRHNAFAFFLAMNSLRAMEYLIHRTYTTGILKMMVFSAPFLVVALWFGSQLHLRINDHVFRRVVSWMILFGGLMLFHR